MQKLYILAILLLVAGCSTASSTLTPLQRRAIEARQLEGSIDDVFKATVTVLQDKGYTIKTSDYQGGIIYAEAQNQPLGKASFMAKLNVASKACSVSYKATVNFEKITDKITKVRINIYKDVVASGKPMEAWGGPVEEPEAYQDLYAEIQKEMFRRVQLRQ